MAIELGYGTNGFTYIAKGGTTNPALEAPTFFASIFGVKDDSDATKIARFVVSGITTGTVRSFTLPNFNGTLATLAGTETFTNKTLTSPVINSPTGLVKADVGLGSVDNTADTSKPISTLTQAALDLKQTLDSDLTAIAGLSPSNDDFLQRKAGAWTNRTVVQVKTDLALVKGDVGLGNVDNTADTAKPVSTAQQTALDLKANLISPVLVTPNLGTPSAGTLTNCSGLPIAGLTGLGTGIADFLGTPSSANLKTAVTDETGSGALVFANTPTLVTPILGTPTSGTLTNCTGLPQSGVTNLVTDLGNKQATLVNQTNIKSINGTSLLGSGDLTISASPGGSDTHVQFNDGSAFGGDAGLVFNKTTDVLSVNGGLLPITNDTGALGSATLSFADLFLASGGVINFNNGNATITHSAATLTTNCNLNVGGATGKTITFSFGATLGGTAITPDAGNPFSINAPVGVYLMGVVNLTGGTPASASAAGVTGQFKWDSGFLYICTATNTWKRVAVATW